jgi:hypothetical protein
VVCRCWLRRADASGCKELLPASRPLHQRGGPEHPAIIIPQLRVGASACAPSNEDVMLSDTHVLCVVFCLLQPHVWLI